MHLVQELNVGTVVLNIFQMDLQGFTLMDPPHTVPIFNSCTKCVGSPGITQDQLPPSYLVMDAWMTSQLNAALIL